MPNLGNIHYVLLFNKTSSLLLESSNSRKNMALQIHGRPLKEANSDGVGGGGEVVLQVKHCCQVEKCGVDLDGAKKYHKKHKVCQVHAKAPVVLLAGLRQRFCQQCSRFHELSEFDGTKRSCRMRLEEHNKRRRKIPLAIKLEDNQCRQINGEARPHMDMTLSSRNTSFKNSHIHTADISG